MSRRSQRKLLYWLSQPVSKLRQHMLRKKRRWERARRHLDEDLTEGYRAYHSFRRALEIQRVYKGHFLERHCLQEQLLAAVA